MPFLLVTRTADGIYRIGNSMPTQVPLDYSEVQVYEVSGPFDLIQGPGIVETTDIGAWLKEREKGQFTFKLINTDRKPPQSDWAKAIQPGKDYAAPDIASLFRKPVGLIEEWMDNWPIHKHPRLHYRQESVRICNAFQLLKFIQDYEPYLK